jgi:NIPSNAP
VLTRDHLSESVVMIVVRDVFRIDPDGMREAKALMTEARGMMERLGLRGIRTMTDLVGDSYTLVLESQFDSLAAFESEIQQAFQDPEFQAWYPRLRKHIRGGRREVFTIFE